MKTKPFLLATAGSTVDGRTIDENDIDQMASSYDPKTYGARLNIEHIRGLGTEGPFRAYGDVLELSTGEVDVNFNGKTEKRKALFGAFDVTDDAKKLNDAGQKLYPSIEIHPNFGGKGFCYLMGVALTDSPAAIATERLKFNRSLPDAMTLSRDEAALLEFADASTEPGKSGESFIRRFGAMLDDKFSKFGGGKPDEKPAAKKGEDESAAFTIADADRTRPAVCRRDRQARRALPRGNRPAFGQADQDRQDDRDHARTRIQGPPRRHRQGGRTDRLLIRPNPPPSLAKPRIRFA